LTYRAHGCSIRRNINSIAVLSRSEVRDVVLAVLVPTDFV